MSEQLALLPEYLTAHLQLTLIALLLSTAIALPVGVAATRIARLEPLALGVAGVIQTVPGLALLALMVPLLAAVDLRSIGFLPAICGLTLYGVFPILRNTVTGISTVDPVYTEAARGVGMTPLQQLARVELPLAMPVVVAGLRTATVWLVGMATLSTPVGATSLGNYIFSGLQIRNYVAVLVGCVAAGGLALVLDGLVRAVEDGLARRRRKQVAAALGLAALLYGYAGITLAVARFDDRERPVVIGSKPFTEQYVLSAALARLVERETGRRTELVQSLGSTVAFDALVAGEIDLYVDYTGTVWVNQMQGGGSFPGRAAVTERVRRFLREQHDVTFAAMLGFENTYALAVRGRDAERLGLRTISDLAAVAPRFVFGSDYEFFARPEWPPRARHLRALLPRAAVDGRVADVSGGGHRRGRRDQRLRHRRADRRVRPAGARRRAGRHPALRRRRAGRRRDRAPRAGRRGRGGPSRRGHQRRPHARDELRGRRGRRGPLARRRAVRPDAAVTGDGCVEHVEALKAFRRQRASAAGAPAGSRPA